MAKEFFKNLPNTTTPLEASRLNGLLDGEEPMGNLVVDSIRSKNMWIPELGNSVVTSNCTVVIDNDKYKVTTSASASGEFYIGQITASSSSYDATKGILYAVEPNTTYSFSVSNSSFDQNYLTQYNSSKVSLGYTFKGRNFTFTTPSNCYYITIRIGVANITASTTYETTVQLEKGDTITNYAPYQNLKNINTHTTFNVSRNNNNPTAGSWSKVYNNIQTSSSIPAGTYLILASCSFSIGSSVVAGDLASVRVLIDTVEPNSSVRTTVPFINGKVCSCVIPLVYTFSTTATHTLNIEIYSTTSDLTGWYDLQFDFIKLK